eukprot:1177256-Prorocentrum_minimum.AAC.1
MAKPPPIMIPSVDFSYSDPDEVKSSTQTEVHAACKTDTRLRNPDVRPGTASSVISPSGLPNTAGYCRQSSFGIDMSFS